MIRRVGVSKFELPFIVMAEDPFHLEKYCQNQLINCWSNYAASLS